jgi:hypothetical protein
MQDLLYSYRELNPNNYDDEDLINLVSWANGAYDEISALRKDLELANKRLRKINDLAEEV